MDLLTLIIILLLAYLAFILIKKAVRLAFEIWYSKNLVYLKVTLPKADSKLDKEKETIFEKDEDYNDISQLIKTNLATTEVTQTSTTTNNSNTTTEQAQHTEVVEVPTPQRSRGTTNYTPPRVQNSPTAPSRNSDSSATVTPPAPATPTVSDSSGTSE